MGKIAFVFAGQGAQYSGMGKELYDASTLARDVFTMADSLRENTASQCFSATKEELSITINTQPCLYSVDLAVAESLREHGIIPSAVAGFSLGEIPALAFAGMLTYADGFSLVCKRAQLMQEAAQKTNGAMVAVIKLSNQTVEQLCREYDSVFPVNYNCPGQLVVAGEKEQLKDFSSAVAAAGGRALPLAVSGGFHSPFMFDASEQLYNELENYSINDPSIPIYANMTAKVYEGDYKKLIAGQIKSPVLWESTINNMIAFGIDTFIEVGAGKVLSGLIKKINPDVMIFNVENLESLNNTLQALEKGE